MKWETFKQQFQKLCRYYQINQQDITQTLREFYTSWLGQITEFELAELVKECKDRCIKPERWGYLPEPNQLKEVYDEIRKNLIYDERQEQDCELCDCTGYVVIVDKKTLIESVVTCSCPKGKKINSSRRDRKDRSKRAYIQKLEDVDHNRFNAPRPVPF